MSDSTPFSVPASTGDLPGFGDDTGDVSTLWTSSEETPAVKEAWWGDAPADSPSWGVDPVESAREFDSRPDRSQPATPSRTNPVDNPSLSDLAVDDRSTAEDPIGDDPTATAETATDETAADETETDGTMADRDVTGRETDPASGSETELAPVSADSIPRDPSERRRVYTALLRAFVDDRQRGDDGS